MRLVDADKLPYVNKVILVDELDGDIIVTIAKEYTSYVNDETPTVKAIPVEWVDHYIKHKVEITGITEEVLYINDMLRAWEKENEKGSN